MSTTITITEALAKLKTIGKRLEKKTEFVLQYSWRQNGVRDRLSKDGGEESAVSREMQAIRDLESEIVYLRRSIAVTNSATMITICDDTRSVQDWLTWRREVYPRRKLMLDRVASLLIEMRKQAVQRGVGVKKSGEAGEQAEFNDVLVNIDEPALQREREKLETIHGELDGQLSLKNASTQIII